MEYSNLSKAFKNSRDMLPIPSFFLDLKYSRPDFLIIGAQKGGTTSLYDFLMQHPQMLPASAKEVHYFSYRHARGELWYRRRFPSRNRVLQTSKKLRLSVKTGEASPSYLLYPDAAQRAHRFMPRGKFIVLLRNPVDRAYSQYQMNRNKKETKVVVNNVRTQESVLREPLSFEEALASEAERMIKARRDMANGDERGQWFQMHSYQTRGLYAEQIERWLAHFAREQFLFLDSSQLSKNTDVVFAEVLEFLELQPLQLKKYDEKHVGTYSEPMNPATRQQLVDFFRPHNQKLYNLLGRRFDWDK